MDDNDEIFEGALVCLKAQPDRCGIVQQIGATRVLVRFPHVSQGHVDIWIKRELIEPY
jgi:hypothetical protein